MFYRQERKKNESLRSSSIRYVNAMAVNAGGRPVVLAETTSEEVAEMMDVRIYTLALSCTLVSQTSLL